MIGHMGLDSVHPCTSHIRTATGNYVLHCSNMHIHVQVHGSLRIQSILGRKKTAVLIKTGPLTVNTRMCLKMFMGLSAAG